MICTAKDNNSGTSVLPWMKNLLEKKSGESSQIILVAGGDPPSFSAKVYFFERNENHWYQTVEPVDASTGRNGFALPGKKREGDGKTPSGIYPLEFAFGYMSGADTKMNYFRTTERDVWVDDINSPDYNRWVKKEQTEAKSFEKMKRNDEMYKYVIAIGYNTSPVIRGHGSAIFLHVWKGRDQPTAGCIAISEKNMVSFLSKLDQSKKPLIIMGVATTMMDDF